MMQPTFRYHKYHASGNVYIVVDPTTCPRLDWGRNGLSAADIQLLCDYKWGLGSDGLLIGPIPDEQARFGVRIFNPDGVPVEISGNGVRIFARFLFDQYYVPDGETFSISTLDRHVLAAVEDQGDTVRANLGKVLLGSDAQIGGVPRRESLKLASGQSVDFYRASLGNPHCVVLTDSTSAEQARLLGPHLECHGLFPDKTNVQFVQVIDTQRVRVESWERGTGYTISSDSGASAVAAVLIGLGLCDRTVTVDMPGGPLVVTVSREGDVSVNGPVTPISRGTWLANQERAVFGMISELPQHQPKSTPEEIRNRFDNDVDRFSSENTGQETTMDASTVLELATEAAFAACPNATDVLDIGCGAGNYGLRLLKERTGLSFTLIDLSERMLDRAQSRLAKASAATIRRRQGDVREVSLEPRSYDVVTAGAVLHHLRNPLEWYSVFRKVFAALRPGGIFLISDLVDHDDEDMRFVIKNRYAAYLRDLRDAAYQEHVFRYIEREDTPRSVAFHIDAMRDVGFEKVEVLHKNSCFATLSARVPQKINCYPELDRQASPSHWNE